MEWRKLNEAEGMACTRSLCSGYPSNLSTWMWVNSRLCDLSCPFAALGAL